MQNTNTQHYNECVLQCPFRRNISVFTLFQFHVEVATRTQGFHKTQGFHQVCNANLRFSSMISLYLAGK